MRPVKRTKRPRRPTRQKDGWVADALPRPPCEWDSAIDTILAAWTVYNATVGIPSPDDKTLRASIKKRIDKARELFALGHGAEDGQTCRCRIWALLTVISLDTSHYDVQEAEQVFDTHKRIVIRYLDATREVN